MNIEQLKERAELIIVGLTLLPLITKRGRAAGSATIKWVKAWWMLPKAVADITHQLHPNGGSSMFDKLTRIEQQTGDNTRRIDLHNAISRAVTDAQGDVAIAYCNALGENTHVNDTYCDWIEGDSNELRGKNWLSRIPLAERAKVRDEFEACREDWRTYRMEHHLTTTHGQKFKVLTTAKPYPATLTEDTPEEQKQWIVVIKRMNDD